MFSGAEELCCTRHNLSSGAGSLTYENKSINQSLQDKWQQSTGVAALIYFDHRYFSHLSYSCTQLCSIVLSHLFFLQITLVKLKVVDLNGERAFVPHHHLLLIPDTVWQHRAELNEVALELNVRLKTLTSTQQRDAMTTLAESEVHQLLVGSLYGGTVCNMYKGKLEL